MSLEAKCPAVLKGEHFLENDPIHGGARRFEAKHSTALLAESCRPSASVPYLAYPHDEQAFFENVRKSRPCMINGVVEHEKWLASGKWQSADSFCGHYGDVQVTLTKEVSAKFSEFVSFAQHTVAIDPFYATIRGKFTAEQSGLLGDFRQPRWFDDDVLDWLQMDGSFTYFLVGGPRTGTKLHIDPMGTAAWNTLLCGHKRWCLFPPGNDAEYLSLLGVSNSYNCLSPAEWFSDVYPQLKERETEVGMIEILQRPFETIFVPAGWWHIVLNLDLTIAITCNHMLPCMVKTALQTFERESPLFGRMFKEGLNTLSEERRMKIDWE